MRSGFRRLLAGFVAHSVLAVGAVAAADVPSNLTEQGRLFDSAGAPLNASVVITFTIYDAPSGGSALWSETQTVMLDEGYFSVPLGVNVPFPSTLWDGSVRFIGIAV